MPFFPRASHVKAPFVLGILLGSLLLLQGCAPPLYTPNTVHSPMLRQAGEVQVGGMITSSGTDAEAAVALTNHVGIVGGLSVGSECEEDYGAGDVDVCTPEDPAREHNYAEAGVVLTTRVGDLSSMGMSSGSIGVEVLSGYGRGSAMTVGDFDYRIFRETRFDRVEMDYGRFFVQPGVFVDVGLAQFGMSARVSHLSYREYRSTSPDLVPDGGDTFLETAMTLRAGPDPFLVFLQVSRAEPLSRTPVYPYREDTVSLGLRLRLDTFFRE